MSCLSINKERFLSIREMRSKINKSWTGRIIEEWKRLTEPLLSIQQAKMLFIVSTSTRDCHSGACNARIQSISDITLEHIRCQVVSLPLTTRTSSSFIAEEMSKASFLLKNLSLFVRATCLRFLWMFEIKFLGHEYHIFILKRMFVREYKEYERIRIFACLTSWKFANFIFYYTDLHETRLNRGARGFMSIIIKWGERSHRNYNFVQFYMCPVLSRGYKVAKRVFIGHTRPSRTF